MKEKLLAAKTCLIIAKGTKHLLTGEIDYVFTAGDKAFHQSIPSSNFAALISDAHLWCALAINRHRNAIAPLRINVRLDA
jgi:hypothetical protein